VKVHGRIGLQQRVLPDYRVGFFDQLAARCPDGLTVAAGEPRPTEAIVPAANLGGAGWKRLRNVHLFAGPLYLCLQPGLRAWLDAWDPRVLILEANPRYLSNWGAAAWMRARGRPVVGWGLGAPGVQGAAKFVWEAWARRLDGAIAYSRRGAAEYARAGLSQEKVWIAPNAVSAAPGPIGRRVPMAGRAPRVIYVGRLQARKRVDLLLEAAVRLDPAPEVWIVGDGPARPDLVRKATALKVSARFFGSLRGSALEVLLDEADLFVLPGTGGLAVQQAMARGLPVIAAEGDGTQEDLVSPENGWLVPPGDGRALTEALREALADPRRLFAMGEASHRLARERFNLDSMVDVFVRALSEIGGGV